MYDVFQARIATAEARRLPASEWQLITASRRGCIYGNVASLELLSHASSTTNVFRPD